MMRWNLLSTSGLSCKEVEEGSGLAQSISQPAPLLNAFAQERMMTSFLLRREEEERVTSYSGRGESRISRVYYK